MTKRQDHSRGFTLLETLVTLVIVSMLVVVLMQALQQALGLRTRLLRHDTMTRTAMLQEAWFRETVESAIADLPDALGSPEGTADAFAFVTAAPLAGGGLARVEWSLRAVDGGVALDYQDDLGHRFEVVQGPLREASFAYQDEAGTWHDAWTPEIASASAPARAPLPEGAEGMPVPLPRMVRLTAEASAGTMVWLVPVLAEPRPPLTLRPEDFGIGL